MTTAEEVATVLSRTEQHPQRTLWFVALLRKEANLGPDDIVVVGGSAIEIYTAGGYVSGDIDLCGPAEALTPVLKRWGFEQPGREWVRIDWGIVIDIVGRFPSGTMVLTRVVDTPHGPVRVGAVEDLILGRLALIKFWNEPDESVNARMLVRLPDVDWAYLEFRAKQENVADLLRILRSESRPGSKQGQSRRKTRR